jgi:hypothetical protein
MTPAPPCTFASIIARYGKPVAYLAAGEGDPVDTDTLDARSFVDLLRDAQDYLSTITTSDMQEASEVLGDAWMYLNDALCQQGEPGTKSVVIMGLPFRASCMASA